MESISNAAQAASKYIFGDSTNQSGTEPISGETGKGTPDEPYDAGNKEDGAQKESEMPSSEHNVLEKPNTASVDKSGDYDAPSDQQPVQNPEGGDRPVDQPADAEEKDKDKGEELIENKDPNDRSGEPMKMHEESEKKDGDRPQDNANKGSDEKGTGEQWVKSSGLAAEGGDFDATKPGAGREADRLMEQKGIHKSEAGNSAPVETSPDDDGTHKKQSKTQKIKDKLHIGIGKHS